MADEAVYDAADTVRTSYGSAVDVDGRRLRLVEPVRGDPGNAVLRTIGLVETVTPLGAAAHGAGGVAAGAWLKPELYLVRWTKGKRWVVGYRLGHGARPNQYVRTEGRIPTHLEIGNWYSDVPDEVTEAFLAAGISLDNPPFEIPRIEPTVVVPPSPARPRASTPAAARKPRPTAPKPAAVARTKPDAMRVCPGCRMHKGPGQFIATADLCVDCR